MQKHRLRLIYHGQEPFTRFDLDEENMKPFKPQVSVAMGVFDIFVGLLIWSPALLGHHPVTPVVQSMAVLFLICGAGMLLREWRLYRARTTMSK